MSGCYNGLQALIQKRINTSIVCIHCYAHALNLVMADSAAVAVDVVTIFGNLETIYLLSQKDKKDPIELGTPSPILRRTGDPCVEMGTLTNIYALPDL